MKVSFIISSVCVVLVSAVFVVLIEKRQFSRKKELNQDKTNASKGMAVNVSEVLKEGIMTHRKDFTGLYELMYQISLNDTRNASGTFGEWCLRIENFEEDTPFASLFRTWDLEMKDWDGRIYQKHASEIVHAIFSAGITRDMEKDIISDKETASKYVHLKDVNIVPGNSYQVFRPCWYSQYELLEKGILDEK